MQVYVLLFNAGTDNEGIHSLQQGQRNTVLMFESEDDAVRFGLMLEAQDFPVPTVEAFDAEEIEAFCNESGFDYKVVPEGALAVPPEANVEKPDWDAEEKPRDRPRPGNVAEPSLSESELDDIRKRLENLL
ncbi:MAG: DUF3110 domain-containing protein [Leptolyngbyaceae cyanobacterium T60_A2020_046]|nr:DUF3110 domain-containing protein [Leptolyngbyaceae cyanobacterium T60_A2020_046]